MGKGQIGVLDAMHEIEQSLPFKLLGIDSDNGTEFINYHLKAFCDQREIQFTRGRPYQKDDNAHIEQKNWTHVRKILGYLRYDSQPVLNAINDLYQNELGWMMNLFQPSVKLVKKIRLGSKLKRVYDKPTTPLDTLLSGPECRMRKGHATINRIPRCRNDIAIFQALSFFALNPQRNQVTSRQILIRFRGRDPTVAHGYQSHLLGTEKNVNRIVKGRGENASGSPHADRFLINTMEGVMVIFSNFDPRVTVPVNLARASSAAPCSSTSSFMNPTIP